MKKPILQLKYLLITARPKQWLKNLSVFTAIVFGGRLLVFVDNQVYINYYDLGLTAIAFLIFCGVSSGVYITNDIVDATSDKLHPLKQNRPLASGKLNLRVAQLSAIIILASLLLISSYYNKFFFSLTLAYILLQLLYTFVLKGVVLLDALTVALGFIFRVYAGSLIIEQPISSWLILATIGLSMLLAFGKRRSEKTLLRKKHLKLKTRKTLKQYPDALLDSMISVSASITIMSYVLFAFQTSPVSTIVPFMHLLPTTLLNPKWMMLTIPFVIYGVGRYLFVIYEKEEGESPADVLLSDKQLLTTVFLWGISITSFIYGIRTLSVFFY